ALSSVKETTGRRKVRLCCQTCGGPRSLPRLREAKGDTTAEETGHGEEGDAMRSIHDLTTEEAYRLATEHFGHELPPLDAVENEDWGRDYVLQCLLHHSPEELEEVDVSPK